MEDHEKSTFLYAAVYALCHEMLGHISGEKIHETIGTVQRFALYSAAAGIAANIIPGAGGLAAALAQTAVIWTLYVQINKIFGLNMSESTLKFIGSAMLTNISVNAGALVVGYAAAAVLSFIPVFGQYGAAVADGALGYIIIYISAVLYLVFLTQIFKAKGKIEITGSRQDQETIEGVIKNFDLKRLIQEARDYYKRAKKNGDLERATSNLKCPVCGASITADQEYCTNCGAHLK